MGAKSILSIKKIKLKNGNALGLKIEMESAPLILIMAGKGFLMCGYLDMATANSLNDVAVKVRGVSEFEEALGAEVVEVSSSAAARGISVGVSGRDALEKMF